MNVTYQNTFEDVVALTGHHLSTDAAYHKRRRWDIYGSPLLLVAVFAAFAESTGRSSYLILGLIIALVSFLQAIHAYRHFPRKAAEKFQRERPQKAVFCRHTITISPEGISEESPESRQFHTWSALSDIVFTPDYIFVYITPVTAHIIPRRELGHEQFQRVADEIQKSRGSESQLGGSLESAPCHSRSE